jgi:type VI secretion system protein ImpC
MQIPSLPFKILALGPFRPLDGRAWNQDPIPVDKTNIDQVLENFRLSLDISLAGDLGPSHGLTLHFRKLKDFHPDRILENTPYLKNILDAKRFIEEAENRGLSEEETFHRLSTWPDFPQNIELKTRKSKEPPTNAVENILEMVALPGGGFSSSRETQSLLDQVDSFLQRIVKQVLADENFRNLESVWQGLRLLLKQGGINGSLSLKIVPISFETLGETIDLLMGRLLRDLPSLLLIDLPLDSSARSLESLEKISLFAENLLVPALFPITPRFFHLDTWADLPKIPFLPHYLQEAAFAKWRHFKGTPSSRWVALTCNRLLARYPYGPNNKTRLVRLEESGSLWISPVWALGSLIGQSLLKTGWPTRFTHWHEVRLEDLPLRSREGNQLLPTEVAFPEDRISQFIRAGIIPFVSPLNQDIAFVPAEATAAGGSLSYQLFLSRVTSLLLWCKDHFPADLEGSAIETGLQKAIMSFWERTGQLPPLNLDISVTGPKPGEPATVKVLLQPPRQVLPSGDKVEMEFHW